MNKHAYLIMCHNELYILEKLISLLDNKHNDIYIHIDKKNTDINPDRLEKIVKNSNIYFIKRMNVSWSTYSQIQCELNLLKAATKGNYSYYHLISGVDFILRPIEEIYRFFEENNGKEFVSFKNFNDVTREEINRIRYYHIFNNYRRCPKKIKKKIFETLYYRLLSLQMLLKINRLKYNNLELRKGANWFSITDELAKYVLSQEKNVKKMYSYSSCADELFLQTILYNSKFKENIYNKYGDEHLDVKRYIDWNRGEPYTFKNEDFDELINTKAFFARKFSTKIDKKIIDKLYRYIKEQSK